MDTSVSDSTLTQSSSADIVKLMIPSESTNKFRSTCKQHGSKHCIHRRRSCLHRVKSAEFVRKPTKLKVIRANPKPITANSVSKDRNQSDQSHVEQTVPDANTANVQSTSNMNTEGDIRLKSIENTIVSQRAASIDETQVGNYPTFVSSSCVPHVETICCETHCTPSSSIIHHSSPTIIQQVDPILCVPQQSPSQVFLCQEKPSPSYICSPSSNQIVQTVSLVQPQQPQPQYICIGSIPSSATNPVPVLSTVTSQTQPQQLLCIPQLGNVLVQQQSPAIQIVQTVPAQPNAGYIEISSASPQIIQAVQPRSAAIQAIQASPQILYQRPYDPVVVPIQNQQIAIAHSPTIALSQPAYAPQRIIQGPTLFRNALAKTVSRTTGVPVVQPGANVMQIVQPSIARPSGAATILPAVGSQQHIDVPSRSSSLPIVPLTPGGLLIPFQPSTQKTGFPRGSLFDRAPGSRLNQTNFDRIREQIDRRAALLETYKRQNDNRVSSTRVLSDALPTQQRSTLPDTFVPSAPVPSALTRPAPSLPAFGTNASSTNQTFPIRSGSILNPPSSSPLPPPMINSYDPYSRKNSSTSSSGSSGSSSSSSAAAPYNGQASSSRPAYSQPFFNNSRSTSMVSGPSTAYRTLPA